MLKTIKDMKYDTIPCPLQKENKRIVIHITHYSEMDCQKYFKIKFPT